MPHSETAWNFFPQSINLYPFKMLMLKALKTQLREIKHVYKHVETVSEKTHKTPVPVSDGRACPRVGDGVETVCSFACFEFHITDLYRKMS